MVMDVRYAADLRDRLHNRDLSKSEDMKVYEKYLRQAICINELHVGTDEKTGYPTDEGKIEELAYFDNAKIPRKTIGIGFNMDAPEAKKYWNDAFKGSLNFQEYYDGKRRMTREQANTLLDTVIKSKRSELESNSQYGKILHLLRPNERLVIEEAYYNGPKLVAAGTNFHKFIHNYVQTRDASYLKQAVFEIEKRSNPSNDKGTQNRRNAQAKLLASYECKFYQKPNQSNLFSDLYIVPVEGRTIIPKFPELQCYISSTHFIWRTKQDEKVRPEHAYHDGRIYSIKAPPKFGNPGDDYNCRCEADFLIPYNVARIMSEFEYWLRYS